MQKISSRWKRYKKSHKNILPSDGNNFFENCDSSANTVFAKPLNRDTEKRSLRQRICYYVRSL